MTVSIVPVDEVIPYRQLAHADGIQLKLDQKMGVEWFGARSGAHLLAFTALGDMGNGRWRVRSVWVRPDERGQGHSAAIMDRIVEVLRERAPGTVSVWHRASLNHDFYLQYGFADTGRRHSSSGAWYLETPLEKLVARG